MKKRMGQQISGLCILLDLRKSYVERSNKKQKSTVHYDKKY